MSTVILLSSSPPPVFARSPTPADVSSPLPSTAALIQGGSPGNRKFKTSKKSRDSFCASFRTARQVLVEKDGAKNLLIGSPRRNRFKSSQDNSSQETTNGVNGGLQPKVAALEKCSDVIAEDRNTATEQIQASTDSSSKATTQSSKRTQRPLSPLLLEKAAARRLDWTPPKVTVGDNDGESTSGYSAGYLSGVVGSFAYIDNTRTSSASRSVSVENSHKRQRIAPAKSKPAENKRTASAPRLIPAIPVTKASSNKRNRSPAKKGLTITGLATSNFIGQDEPDESPMMQYLTSTQAQMNEDDIDTVLQTKAKKTKIAAKNLKTTKKAQLQPLLLSPTSALRMYDEQETIFGSASQLAREESPHFLRETLEALKQSESLIMSDPFSSPQRTQTMSIKNTPRTGTSKYRKTRNLWAAAGRDEDNALLHVDTVDLADSPAIRAAFAGKDVMLQASAKRSKSPVKSGPAIHTTRAHKAGGSITGFLDISDIDSPCSQQKRMISSTTKSTPMQASEEPQTMKTNPVDDVKAAESMIAKEKAPPKPNYAGFATSDLQKQIKAFGFKALRKREKMIELLDRCWEEKHGPSEDASHCEPDAVLFGDFLSKVHDLSARPEPKPKKARARKKEGEAEGQPTEKPARKPRQRKKKDAEDEHAEDSQKATKRPLKRKSKVSAVTQELVFDIDDVGDTISEEQRALCAFDDWAKPPPKVKAKAKEQDKNVDTTRIEVVHALTPPATLPHIVDETAAKARPTEQEPLQTKTATTVVQAATPLPTPAPTTSASQTQASSDTPVPTVPIHDQITAAILQQKQSTTANHNTHPTWHEKMLLYDPIVLEDLAQWLNTEGLDAVREDHEVSAVEVRAWCEQRGICCLWRGGWRGNKEGRS